MTPAEKQEIVSAVLEAIKAMSTSIPQMTAVTSIPSGAYIELDGARKISVELLLESAVQRALTAADIAGLNQRIETISRNVERDIRSLGNAISEIPIVYVDSALDASSNNAISNAAVSAAVSKFVNLANAISEIDEAAEEPTGYDRGVAYASGDIFVAYTFERGYDTGKTRILLYRPTNGYYYGSWYGAPEGYGVGEVSAVNRLWLYNGNVYQGTGRDGFVQPLGAMMAQHNILSQDDYDLLPDATKDQFELFLTY